VRDSQIVRKHAEELLEHLKKFARFHPETTDEQMTDVIELYMLRSQVNTTGNVHDEE